jgi:hypothetical protein
MLERLVQHGETIGRDAQQQRIETLAGKLRELVGAAAVQVEEARVLVRGQGMIKRWLIDPSLRFLAGSTK